MIETLCPPALIYVCFSLTQIIIDTFKGLYTVAFFKFWVMLIFTFLLNILCAQGLGIISWLIVFIPFMLMSVITMILIFAFGLDPETGKIMAMKNNHHKKDKKHHKKRDKKDHTQDDSESDDEYPDKHKKHHDKRKRHHNKKHEDPECKKKGCTVMPNKDDGNCDEIKKENGYCYKQCYMKCSNFDSSDKKCNYDSDCKPGCAAPKFKVPCDDQYSQKPSNPGSVGVEKFINNMLTFNSRLN
jgi:hypothetical protein